MYTCLQPLLASECLPEVMRAQVQLPSEIQVGSSPREAYLCWSISTEPLTPLTTPFFLTYPIPTMSLSHSVTSPHSSAHNANLLVLPVPCQNGNLPVLTRLLSHDCCHSPFPAVLLLHATACCILWGWKGQYSNGKWVPMMHRYARFGLLWCNLCLLVTMFYLCLDSGSYPQPQTGL